jgi:hypothetical protein
LIDRKIFKALKERLGISSSAVYERIDKLRESKGFTISRESSAELLASENGIDVSKYLSREELSELRKLQIQSPTIITKVVNKKMTPHYKILNLGSGVHIQDALLPAKMTQEAAEMANIYPIIYTFENSVRNVISLVLYQKYGENWWETKVSAKIQDKVKDRKLKESDNPWHGKRGAAPIFYTDIGHLLSIIKNNWSDFESLFPNQSWIESRINEIEISRNIVAHNNPLAKRDIQRLSLYFEDWEKQVKIIKERI